MRHWHAPDIVRLLAVIIGVADVLFLALFALDVFAPGLSLSQQLTGLAMHLLPSAGLALAIAIAWRWGIAGGIALMLLSTVPFLTLSNPLWVNGMLGVPVFAAGGLFLLGGLWHRRDVARSRR